MDFGGANGTTQPRSALVHQHQRAPGSGAASEHSQVWGVPNCDGAVEMGAGRNGSMHALGHF